VDPPPKVQPHSGGIEIKSGAKCGSNMPKTMKGKSYERFSAAPDNENNLTQ